MKREEREKIRALARKLVGGKWATNPNAPFEVLHESGFSVCETFTGEVEAYDGSELFEQRKDEVAAYIAAVSPEAIFDLLADVAGAEREVERYRRMVDYYEKKADMWRTISEKRQDLIAWLEKRANAAIAELRMSTSETPEVDR